MKLEGNFTFEKHKEGETTPDILEKKERLLEIDAKIRLIDEELASLELSEIVHDVESSHEMSEADMELERTERMVEITIAEIEEQNGRVIVEELVKISSKLKDKTGEVVKNLLEKVYKAATKTIHRKILTATLLPVGVGVPVALSYYNINDYYEMAQNWKERHWDKRDVEDPSIKGMDTLYSNTTSIERTTYDFLGPQKIDYKSGYYMTSVFDLSDKTPPRFKVLNEDRAHYPRIDDAAGITTNLFKPFYKWSKFNPALKGHTGPGALPKEEIPVIGYNIKDQTMRAGHYKEFSDDWLVSETYEIQFNFKLNPDGTLNLVYHDQAMRMVPESINEKGIPIPFPIGVSTKKEGKKKINPYEATRFGTLDGGKVIMVCGEKQLQVNGSFADIFRVYERLQKEKPNVPIQAYLLDNGSYNVPMWTKDPSGAVTPQMVKDHMLRNRQAAGGTALVLMNDERISPYEYKNIYKEIQHQIEGDTLDKTTGKPAKNERSVVVIHHTGNYDDPERIIREFKDPKNERSAHVLIFKDGTRHLFNDDRSVLAHAGKSDFKDRNAVNFFSLGIELEGDSSRGRQFTLAQLESMLEYLRPRIEKYGITLDNITTHKIIRENYLKKHPEEKGILPKSDLNDKVWENIRELIQKKLYATETPKVAVPEASKLMGALAYQEGYRITQNKDYAFGRLEEMLSAFNMRQDIQKTEDWIKNFS